MKKLQLILVFCAAFATHVFAQPPNGFNYSGVARDANLQPIVSSPVGVQMSILEGSATGTTIYIENHVVTTDAFGLFNLVIGGGAVQSGVFSTIN